MQRNAKFWVVLAIWLSCIVVVVLDGFISLLPTQNYTVRQIPSNLDRFISPLPTQNYTVRQIPSINLTLTNTEDDKVNYQQFLVKLRNQLALDGTVSHAIPVLRATSSSATKYLLVNIKNSEENEITFGLSVLNAYVLACKVGNNSYFFTDKDYKETMMYLFINDTKQTPLTAFSGNYEDFSKKGADRVKTNIGIQALEQHIITLFYNTLPTKISKPLVCVIQMVSEAARFKYIENKITDQDYLGSFTPGSDIITRENNWGHLSEGIQYADKDGYLQKVDKNDKLERTIAYLFNKTVRKVDEIDKEMGILKYAKPVK